MLGGGDATGDLTRVTKFCYHCIMYVSMLLARSSPHPRNMTRSEACPVAIYALYDRRDGCVRYVGKTTRSMSRRIDRHFLRPTNRSMHNWLMSAGRFNVIPEVLEYVSGSDWESFERGWISWFRERGKLLNVESGGVAAGRRQKEQPPMVTEADIAPIVRRCTTKVAA